MQGSLLGISHEEHWLNAVVDLQLAGLSGLRWSPDVRHRDCRRVFRTRTIVQKRDRRTTRYPDFGGAIRRRRWG